MEFLIVFAPMVSVIVLGVWIDSLVARNALEKIKVWAAGERYTVVDARRSWFGGPLWYLTKQGVVFRVTLSNRSGAHGAWVFYPLPLSFYKMKVRWD